MNFRRRRREITELELTPLIDVIFQLLIFFMITTSFTSSPGMAIQRPKAKNGTPLEKKRYTVLVPKGSEGSVVFQGKRFSYDEFKQKLEELYKTSPDIQIAIDADRTVHHQHVVKVMDLISGAGFVHLGIVTTPVAPKPE